MKNGGFTLIEMIMIIVIAAIIIPPMSMVLYQLNVSSAKVIPIASPKALAVELIEEIKGKRWDENWKGGPLQNSEKTSPSALGSDSGEAVRRDYDDMDDYVSINSVPKDLDGNDLPEYTGYTLTVSVQYVTGVIGTPDNPSGYDFETPETDNPPVSDFKRIEVILTKGSEVTRVSTVAGNY